MTIKVTMPALSPTMEEGTLAKWLVKEGDSVEPGDILAEIETDKATMELEAADEGKVGKLLVEEGEEGVKVHAPVAILLEEGEDEDDLKDVDLDEEEDDATDKEKDEEKEKEKEKDKDKDEDEEEGSDKDDEEGEDQDKDQKEDEKDDEEEDEDDEDDEDGEEKEEESAPAGKEDEDDEIPEDAELKKLTVREALRDAMLEEMKRDDDVFLMGEEVAQYQGAYKVSQGLLDEFGEDRVVDTPITEYGFAGLGVGATFAGLKPIVEFMTFNFAMQAIDHIINSAAKTRYMSGGQVRCQMVFRGPNAAASRVAAQHSQNYGPWYAHVPGLKVIAPYSASDAKGLLKAAIRDPNPVVFLENELLYGAKFDVPDTDDFVLPIGKAKVVREGGDVTIIAYSIAVGIALQAAEKLAEDEGIEAEVIDLRTLRPLDMETLKKSIAKTNRAVVAEEGWPQCSIASEISARFMEEAFDELDAPVTRVTDADVPLPYAANLEKMALVSPDNVIKAVKKVCYKD